MKTKFLFLGLLLFATSAFAQEVTTMQPAPKFAARLDVYHQYWIGDFSYGTLAVVDKVNWRPGIRAGIERTWVAKKHFRLYQDLVLGYYHNTYEERSWILGSDIGFEWRIFKQFRAALPLGVHYNNAKAIDVRYVYEGDKWVKAENTDKAISRLQIPVGLQLGWRFMPASPHPVDLFMQGTLSAIGPWQPGSGIPLLFTKAAGMGVRIGL